MGLEFSQITLTAKPLNLLTLPPEWRYMRIPPECEEAFRKAFEKQFLGYEIDDPQPHHVLDSVKSG